MSFLRLPELLSFLFLLLSLLVRDVYAIGVSFTTPGAGSTWPAGPITVKWVDAGGSPNMAALDTYMLQLMVGGNEATNSEAIATLGTNSSSVADGQVEGEIAADVAQSIENGFYFKMTSNTTDGNKVINYSYRFTLISLNGTTSSTALDGANAAAGSDDVPSAQYNVITGPSTSPSTSAATTTTATATATATSEPAQQDGGDSGLTLGAKIGIGAGALLACVGAVSIFAWIFMLYRYKKKRRQERVNTFDKDYPYKGPRVVSQLGKAELPGHSAASSQATIPTELSPIGARYEAHGDARPVEAARASIYELDSGWDGWEAGNGRKSKAYDPTSVI